MSNKTSSKNKKRLEKIYIQHKDQLYNYILRLSNDQNLAQDIVQHTFYKVLSDPEIAKVKHLKAYLFTIAHNKLKDEWKRKPTVPFEGDDTMQDTSDFKVGATPEEITEAGTSDTSVEKTIRQMPRNFSELMLLRYTEDLSIAEIAEITQRSVTDVKVSLHRARLKFETLYTASMYSKIAVSRNRCEIVQDLLLPFHDNDLTTEQLTRINKHIIKCDICTKDAAEMKRTRQLFVALPLIPFPLAFDEFSKKMPQLSPATTTTESQVNDGSASVVTNYSANSEVITQTVGQTVRAKIAAGVAGAVILVGSGFYLAGQDDSLASNTQTDRKKTPEQQASQTPPPVDKNMGSLMLIAKLSSNSLKNLKNVKWKVEPVNKNQLKESIDTSVTTTNDNATLTLPPGSYKITATLDDLEKSEIITIKKGKSSTKSIIFNAGEINVLAPPNKDIDIDDIQWRLYREGASSGNPVAIFTGNFNQYFPAGEYLLRANYQGNLEKQHKILLSPGQFSSVVKPGFRYGQLNLQANLEGTGKIVESTALVQWFIDRLTNGKVDKNNIVRIKEGTSRVLLSPGAYRINMVLGKHVNQSTDVTIQEGKTSLSKGLVLKVGKLTLQAKITLDSSLLPTYVNWKIDKTGANNKKNNIEKSKIESSSDYYLPPGKYQITATYGTNLKAVKAVTIKTGETLIKDDFIFELGIADFTAMDFRNKQTIYSALDWSLEQKITKDGDIYTLLKDIRTSRAIFTLKPGNYRITVEHETNGKLIKEFNIVSGKATKDTLMFNLTSQTPRWEWK